MSSIILLSLLIVAATAALCYLFSEARVELGSPTIAAMEARVDELATERTAAERTEVEVAAPREYAKTRTAEVVVHDEESVALPLKGESASYEYREILEEGGENYVLPQWMLNYFSGSEICHTLDPADNVVFTVKLNEAANAEKLTDVSAECDMATQTISLKFCFGDGTTTETLKTKFYLFERGDLLELNRLVRQSDLRIDVLIRSADLTLEYLGSVHVRLPQGVATQLKGVLARIPT